MTAPLTHELRRVLTGYQAWLDRQPLSPHTRRAYLGRVRQYGDYLAACSGDYGDPLEDGNARKYAARDYKTHLKTVRKARPSTMNLALAAIDNFYSFLGGVQPHVPREDLSQQAPKALEADQQRRFLRAVERADSARDRALALLLFFTGLRVGECAALDVEDVALSARKTSVTVRAGKGNAYREVPLNSEVRAAALGADDGAGAQAAGARARAGAFAAHAAPHLPHQPGPRRPRPGAGRRRRRPQAPGDDPALQPADAAGPGPGDGKPAHRLLWTPCRSSSSPTPSGRGCAASPPKSPPRI